MRNFFQLKSFWNFLQRNRLFTAINVFGFAVSLAFVVLIGLYVQQELAVNTRQPNRDRTYRLVGSSRSNFAPFTGADLMTRYPEIERYTCIVYRDGWELEVEAEASGTSDRYRGTGFFTDSSFFRIFSFPFVEGTPDQALQSKNEVVLTESYARQLFGDRPALGRTISSEVFDELVVCGVVRDFGKETHFMNPDFILWIDNLSPYFGINVLTNTGWCGSEVYFKAHPGADLPAKTADLDQYLHSNQNYWLFVRDSTNHPGFERLEEVYLSQKSTFSDSVRNNDSRFLMVLGITALVILFFAVINYINLSVAQSGFRAKEAATRRLLGGSRGSLFGGFVLESIIICFVSLVLGILMAMTVEPWFREVMQTDISIKENFTAGNVALALAGVLVIGAVSGLVPASVLTRFQPIDVVRGTFRRQTKMVYSKVLIAFQYCITIVLIGCTVTIGRQMDFMLKSDLGFRHDYRLYCSNVTKNLAEQQAVRSELLAIPGVEQVAFAAGVPPLDCENISFTDEKDKSHAMKVFMGDSVYMEMMGYQILHRTGVEGGQGIWLNETAWRRHEISDDDLRFDKLPSYQGPLLGMIRDFHTSDFSEAIDEVMVCQLNEGGFRPWNMVIRVSPTDPFGTMNRVRDWYNDYKGGQFFDGIFLDDAIQQQYEAQQRMAEMVTSFSLLAVLISALGMLAMSTYFMRQRAQEVAVRKVFGATNREVLVRLMASFLRLVLVAFVVAVPMIWYFMSDWLSGYAYRIPLTWSIFALAGAAAFAVAFLTLLWQSLKATRANPVHALHE